MQKKYKTLLIAFLVLLTCFLTAIAIWHITKPKDLSEEARAIIYADSNDIKAARDIAFKDIEMIDTPIITNDVIIGIKDCVLLGSIIQTLSQNKRFRYDIVFLNFSKKHILDNLLQNFAVNMTLVRPTNFKEIENALIVYIEDGKKLSGIQIHRRYEKMLYDFCHRAIGLTNRHFVFPI